MTGVGFVLCFYFFRLGLLYEGLLLLLGSSLALTSKAFCFFAMGGLFNVFTTVFFIMREVTLFLK